MKRSGSGGAIPASARAGNETLTPEGTKRPRGDAERIGRANTARPLMLGVADGFGQFVLVHPRAAVDLQHLGLTQQVGLARLRDRRRFAAVAAIARRLHRDRLGLGGELLALLGVLALLGAGCLI